MPTGTAATAVIGDKEITSMLLADAKACAQKSCHAALEAASSELHRLFMEECERSMQFQREVWEYMSRKGWYNAYQPPRQLADQDLKEAEKAVRGA
jgi:spore coat protein CotF